ncbi:MAG: glycosyltransferase family 2 protein, partial [Clostridia bacterium]|nr:glycosyltransferase family 2 protein [Clostridia bacterium]
VDLEWCFRAQSAGFSTLGVFAARLAHRVGEGRIHLSGGIGFARHKPARLYYMMRNRVRLYRRPCVPRRWIAQDIPRLIGKFLIFSLCAAPRLKNTLSMLRGLSDGIRDRGGRSPDSHTPDGA